MTGSASWSWGVLVFAVEVNGSRLPVAEALAAR